MNYKVSQKVLMVFCIACLAAIVGFMLTDLKIFFYITVGCFLGGFVQGYIFYRCPICKKSLMRHGRAVPKTCPHCKRDIA